ncbi:MotA/TolQ/ExbB proton channel family protein [Aquimarina macrocephali]|uniref:MotA/TolQ/ExbB proton channel family protein n=1 Tax=Aquimarina macrocephali TaxID=666563 RepID=UPI000466EE13|nr:MotA/TolQ/ExbB proton channel family protein [Aquimarina macrocephali]
MISLILNITKLFILQNETSSIFTFIGNRIEEGGMFFMIPIVIMLLLVLFIIIKNTLVIIQRGVSSEKYISLINSMGLLTLVWGLLGQLIGIVGMFDKVEIIDEISTHVFASGLKVSALPAVFGFFVFIVSRIATIIFTWIDKEIE